MTVAPCILNSVEGHASLNVPFPADSVVRKWLNDQQCMSKVRTIRNLICLSKNNYKACTSYPGSIKTR